MYLIKKKSTIPAAKSKDTILGVLKLERIKSFLWGDLSKKEAEKFTLLALTFFLVIGTYWLMRPLKDGLFASIVGRDYLPQAKLVSVVFIFPLVLIYAKLVNLVFKQRLFYILCTVYASIFIFLSILIKSPEIGIANTISSPNRILGWAIYLAIESFGSLMVSLFWSFVASTTKTESAKKGYGLIIFAAQLGSILGPSLAANADYFGIPLLLLIVAGGIALVPACVRLFIVRFPEAAEVKKSSNKKKTGVFEGVRLLSTTPYLLGVLGISTLYEVVGTVIDLQFKFLAAGEYTTTTALTSFLGKYGMATNGVTFILSLLGTSYFIRNFGLMFCLVGYPVCTAIAVIAVWIYPNIWMFFGAMIFVKAISYALNNPCKEIMYIPTSKDVKFKAKSVIDMFGARSAKASGSAITAGLKTVANTANVATVVCMAIIGVWTYAAIFVARKNKVLVDNNLKIGEEEIVSDEVKENVSL